MLSSDLVAPVALPLWKGDDIASSASNSVTHNQSTSAQVISTNMQLRLTAERTFRAQSAVTHQLVSVALPPGKRADITDVVNPRSKHHQPINAEAEAGVRHGAVSAQIQVCRVVLS